METSFQKALQIASSVICIRTAAEKIAVLLSAALIMGTSGCAAEKTGDTQEQTASVSSVTETSDVSTTPETTKQPETKEEYYEAMVERSLTCVYLPARGIYDKIIDRVCADRCWYVVYGVITEY